ncbi:hypothetical protein B0H16DRAFT_1809463 [Mycena metata]|uniref:Uncharacterized protein n=1 Tax=Mycena metata TaxID=1033252 RepID=A0AAD7H6P1_9AGAR|nr:hypothetical protein B0H16DRAFT_1809463 [Mycena metata]
MSTLMNNDLDPSDPICTKQTTTQAPASAHPQSGIHSLEPSYPTTNTAASAFTTAPVAPSAPPTPATPVQTATQSRPKTSHTTIERRYRTNLNAAPGRRVVDRAAAINAGGEKKKRGRPCKVVPLPASATASASANSSHAGSPALALSTSVPMHSSTTAYAQQQQEIMRHQQRPHRRPAAIPPQRIRVLHVLRQHQRLFALFLSSPSTLTLRPCPDAGGHRGQGVRERAREWRGRHGPVAGVPPPRERGGAGERRLARGEGGVGGYLASVSPSSPSAPTSSTEKTKVEEEESSETETETDGERSAGSGGSLSEEDVDADASEEEVQVQAQAQAHHEAEAEACILDDMFPSLLPSLPPSRLACLLSIYYPCQIILIPTPLDSTPLRTAFRLYTSTSPSSTTTSSSPTTTASRPGTRSSSARSETDDR